MVRKQKRRKRTAARADGLNTGANVGAMIDDEMADLRRQLDAQLTRMGQIQHQLDQIHGIVKQILAKS